MISASARQLIADRYAGKACQLDGEPATICGRQHRFAIVASMKDHARKVQYAWPTVALIMENNGGRFSS